MSHQHKALAAGRWQQMSFLEQMANIGSEVERAINWRAKQNNDYSRQAFERALELIDLTLESSAGFSRLKELTRVREAMSDFFCGNNQYASTDQAWRSYFLAFACAVRKDH